MGKLRAGMIGCGGRGKGHAQGYAAAEDVEIVACADPAKEKAEEMAENHEVPAVYADYREMLSKEELDLVSICTWIPSHHDMVIDSVEAGVKAIHAEKPMAPTWGEAKAMQAACDKANVVVTYCHQRRFETSFRTARELGNDGTIGKLHRMEGYCPNLFDWGTHWFDMLFFFNNQTPVKWVMGQIDASAPREIFGLTVETHGLSYFAYENDVMGLLATGDAHGGRCQLRLIGSDGVIEVGAPDEPRVRVLHAGASGWQYPDLSAQEEIPNATILATIDIVEALREGREPELSGRKALMATELIFATYESSRLRSRVELPLEIDDSPFLTMLEAGEVGP